MLNIDKLNWNLPEEQQRRQIETLRLEDDGEIETLILPPGKKDCWQNLCDCIEWIGRRNPDAVFAGRFAMVSGFELARRGHD